MKKLRLVTLAMLSIFALTLAGTATAADQTYTKTDYALITGQTNPVIDGTYGTPSSGTGAEWENSEGLAFGSNGIWRDLWGGGASAMSPNEYILIETADTTDDADDTWQICFDGSADTNPDGGSAPQTNDYRIDITGHGGSATTQWYVGTGSGWTTTSAPAGVTVAEGFSDSPIIGETHYILEMEIAPKTALNLQMYWAIFIAYTDAHTDGNGVQQWPPAATNDNPDGWGYVSYSSDPNPDPDVPEGFGLIAIIALTTVAVVGSAVFLRKKAVPKLSANALI